ncbi:HAD family hydrolase [Sulfitobacter sp. LCG007]
MPDRITTVGFDADDTLWHNERYFQLTQRRLADLLAEYTDSETLSARLLAAERRNLGQYGFGIKGFTLSMIETAIEVTDRRVSVDVIAELMEAGREMLRHPIDLLPHARGAVEAARRTHRVLLITKGDLLDQERKLAQSGLGELFDGVEIVSDKSARVYADIFARRGDGVERGIMVGNSLRSDVLPMIEAGGWGAFVPHELTWQIEKADAPDHPRYARLGDLAELGGVLERIG